MQIVIQDATTPMLSVIAQMSKDVAYEQMSKAGNAIRVNAGLRMKSHSTNWFQRVGKKGKREPFLNLAETKELGLRTGRDGNVLSTPSMSNFISSNLMEASGVLVVGGRNAKKQVIYRKDGLIVGSGKLDTISKFTQSIINKLDTGVRNEYHGWGSNGSEKGSMKNFRGANYRATNFMMEGYMDSVPYIRDQLTTAYEQTIGRAINREAVNIKLEVRSIG